MDFDTTFNLIKKGCKFTFGKNKNVYTIETFKQTFMKDGEDKTDDVIELLCKKGEIKHLVNNTSTETQYSKDVLDELLTKGIEKKRCGDYTSSKQLYLKSQRIDPYNILSYYNLGKVYYLLNDPSNSIRNYLIAMHLQLHNREYGQVDDLNKMMFNLEYAKQTQDLKELLPCRSAFLVFLDPNTPRHLGHAVIDFNDSLSMESNDIYACGKIYRADLSGNKPSLNEALNKYKMSYDDFEKIDLDHFMNVGSMQMLSLIKWEKLANKKAWEIY